MVRILEKVLHTCDLSTTTLIKCSTMLQKQMFQNVGESVQKAFASSTNVSSFAH